MSLTPVDHTAGMNADLVGQFKGLPNIGYFITAFGAQLNDVDEFFRQLYSNLNLQNSVGVQLDAIGSILKQARNGLSDSAYRTLLEARIGAYQSQGTVENLIQMLLTLAGSSEVQVTEGTGPDITVTAVGVNTPVTHSDVIAALFQGKAAGVNMALNAVTTLPAFAFDTPASSLTAGFDVGHLSGPFV